MAQDAPRLEAYLDTDGEDDQLHVTVTENGTVYDRVEVDLDTLLRTDQYLETFSRPTLTLLSLYDRHVAEDEEGEKEPLEVE